MSWLENDISKWLKSVLNEEVEEATPTQETEDSLDAQVDRYLTQYESEAKNSVTEGLDFRAITRRFLSEAEGDEETEEQPEEDPVAAEPPTKLTLEDIDIESFANSVSRMIENIDNLLEYRNTLLRRGRGFLAKIYDEDVVSKYEEVMREAHGISDGQTEMEVEDEEFVAPPGEGAGPGGDGGSTV